MLFSRLPSLLSHIVITIKSFFSSKMRILKQSIKRKRLKELGCRSYQHYLDSSYWHNIRKKFYTSKYCPTRKGKPCCSVCGSFKNLNIHHRNYKYLGRERLSKLVLLCQNCHYLTHDILQLVEHEDWRLDNAHLLTKKIYRNRRLHLKLFQKD